MVAYLVQEPARGETGRDVMERLRPLAQALRTTCGTLDIPVVEALCISDGRYWSYCCPGPGCCPAEGRSMGLPGTSVLAAAATYAGLQVRGTLKEFRARLSPWETSAALDQEVALGAASRALVPRILDGDTRDDVAAETLALAERVMARLAMAPPLSGKLPADLRDDELLGHDEAATLIIGLQDRTTRDRAAEWMEGAEAMVALRLWRALARRCVGSYGEHAAAPLTLAGWVAWSTGDELEAREAFAMALGADSGYLFARLLHQACNEGLDPESVRRCLRAGRADRAGEGPAAAAPGGTATPAHGLARGAGQEFLGGDVHGLSAEVADALADGRPTMAADDAPLTAQRLAAAAGGEPVPAESALAAGRASVPDGSTGAVERVEPPTVDSPAAPATTSSSSGQSATTGRPRRAFALSRRQGKVRPPVSGSRPSRRSPRTAGTRRRRPFDAPTTGERARLTPDNAPSRPGTRHDSGRSARDGGAGA